ncbi:MAG: hypothetical protein LBJ59_00810 [Zoogloeaceae bacterium]|nr:hypothetical protein [Zoogloeaceae bacterium]
MSLIVRQQPTREDQSCQKIKRPKPCLSHAFILFTPCGHVKKLFNLALYTMSGIMYIPNIHNGMKKVHYSSITPVIARTTALFFAQCGLPCCR